MPTISLKCEDDRSIKGNITHSACTRDEQILNLYYIFLCDRLGWCVRHNPIAIIVAGSLLFFPYPKVRGVPNVAERGHSSVTGVEGSSSLVDSFPGINQSPRNAAMLSVIITTPAAPLTTDNRD